MTDITDYFEPTSTEAREIYMPKEETLGAEIRQGRANGAKEANVVLLTATSQEENQQAVDHFREELYSLRGGLKNISIWDLGSLKGKGDQANSYHAMKCVMEEIAAEKERGKEKEKEKGERNLIAPDTVIVAITDRQYLAGAMLEGLTKKKSNLAVIASRPSYSKCGTAVPEDNNWLTHAMQEGKVARCNIMGYQNYLSSPGQKHELKENNMLTEDMRLGLLRADIWEAEPRLRDSDLLAMDMGAIKAADAPAAQMPSVNGLYGEEACQLMWFAGTSDRLKAAVVSGLSGTVDDQGRTARLAAQMLWHTLEALDKRLGEYPKESIDKNKRLMVSGKTGCDIIFYQSRKMNRWWMEVPRKNGAAIILPCTEKDYKEARSGDIPQQWYRYYMK